jgi:hypothetical protein
MSLSHLMLLLATLLATFAPGLRVQAAAGPAGHWEGKIQIPEREIAFAVDLTQSPAGGWIGSLTIKGATVLDVPLTDISVKDATVRFTASLPGTTSFDGSLSADAGSLTGKVSNVEGAVPFALARSGEANVKLPPASSPLSKEFEGTWEGAVVADGNTRRIVLKLSAAPDGTAKGLLISVDKGNLEIPVTTVTLKGNQLELDARAVGGTYRGTLGANGEIAGEWVETAARMAVTFKRAATAK